MKRFINLYKNLSNEAKASAWFVVCNIIQKGISFFLQFLYLQDY